jgi:hypothetical protein
VTATGSSSCEGLLCKSKAFFGVCDPDYHNHIIYIYNFLCVYMYIYIYLFIFQPGQRKWFCDVFTGQASMLSLGFCG